MRARRGGNAGLGLAAAAMFLLAAVLWLAPTPAMAQGQIPLYLKLKPLIVPVLVEGRVRGKITLALKLHVLDRGDRKDVQKHLPKLRDSFLSYLYTYASSTDAAGVPQLASILGRFQRMVDKRVGKGKVLVHQALSGRR